MDTEEEHKKYIAGIVANIIESFNIMPAPSIIDAIIININLYKAGKANPMDFAVILGSAATAFMNKIRDQAREEDKLYTAQPNPEDN